MKDTNLGYIHLLAEQGYRHVTGCRDTPGERHSWIVSVVGIVGRGNDVLTVTVWVQVHLKVAVVSVTTTTC